MGDFERVTTGREHMQLNNTEKESIGERKKKKEKKTPASSDPLKSSKQAEKPFVLGSSTFFRMGKPFSAAYF